MYLRLNIIKYVLVYVYLKINIIINLKYYTVFNYKKKNIIKYLSNNYY